jgi:RIO kinase 1
MAALVDLGIIQEVVRPLMSGKEAQIYLVVSGGELRVAKVYKAAQNRSFRQRVEYTEGRVVRNTRTQRAMSKHSRHGRAQDEASWRSAEVDIIYRLRAAGVRVPEPHHFSDGILVMELVTDVDGDPAPRLADVELDRVEAGAVFSMLLSSVVKMLCAGVVHGDLSDYNVLMGQDGPVLIDFPQAVDPAHNQNARKLLLRDVEALNQFLTRFAPGQRPMPYGPELWDLYTRGVLTPWTQLTGQYKPAQRKADTSAVLREIDVAARDARRRRDAMAPGPGRRGRQSKRQPRAPTTTATTPTTAALPPEPARSAPTTAGPTTRACGPGDRKAVEGGAPKKARSRRRRRRRRASGAGQATT